MLANFLGVLPILTPPLCALAFIMCSKSNPIVVFALVNPTFKKVFQKILEDGRVGSTWNLSPQFGKKCSGRIYVTILKL
jgi:hypothetical protein